MLKIYVMLCFLASNGHCTPEIWDHTEMKFPNQEKCAEFLEMMGALNGIIRKGDAEIHFRCGADL